MNKTEAAAYLKVSKRAIERYTSQGKLTPKYEKGRTGLAPVYTEAQLDEVKRQMDAAAKPAPALVRQDAGDKPAKRDKPDSVQAVALLERIASALNNYRAALPAVSLSEKFRLTVTEAAQLSGLSKSEIEKAIKAGKLKSEKRGAHGARVIKREDLIAYNKKH